MFRAAEELGIDISRPERGSDEEDEKEFLEMLMVQSKESGAVLLVTGGASVLIVSNAEKDAHKAIGIPLLAVSGTQFRHYELLREDV